MPGVKNPVKFWMYWNADSMLPSNGCAHKTAITNAITATFLPTDTSFVSDGFKEVKFL